MKKTMLVLSLLAFVPFAANASGERILLDFSNGHSLSVIEESGANIRNRGPKMSDSIEEKQLTIRTEGNKEFEIDPNWAYFWSSGQDLIDFIVISSGFLSREDADLLLESIEKCITHTLDKEREWAKSEEFPGGKIEWFSSKTYPRYEVIIGRTFVTETPVYVHFRIQWKSNI